jgi:hypothetical protein
LISFAPNSFPFRSPAYRVTTVSLPRDGHRAVPPGDPVARAAAFTNLDVARPQPDPPVSSKEMDTHPLDGETQPVVGVEPEGRFRLAATDVPRISG